MSIEASLSVSSSTSDETDEGIEEIGEDLCEVKVGTDPSSAWTR